MISLRNIGEQIRLTRKQQKLTGEALAARCNIHRTTLVKLEKGTGNVELNTLIALCEALGLTIRIVPTELDAIPSSLEPKNLSKLQNYLAQAPGESPLTHQSASSDIHRPRLAMKRQSREPQNLPTAQKKTPEGYK